MFVSQGADNSGRERLKFGSHHFFCAYMGFQPDHFEIIVNMPRVITGMHQLKSLLIEQEKMGREA